MSENKRNVISFHELKKNEKERINEQLKRLMYLLRRVKCHAVEIAGIISSLSSLGLRDLPGQLGQHLEEYLLIFPLSKPEESDSQE